MSIATEDWIGCTAPAHRERALPGRERDDVDVAAIDGQIAQQDLVAIEQLPRAVDRVEQVDRSARAVGGGRDEQ
jgi:hypothetical protein